MTPFFPRFCPAAAARLFMASWKAPTASGSWALAVLIMRRRSSRRGVSSAAMEALESRVVRREERISGMSGLETICSTRNKVFSMEVMTSVRGRVARVCCNLSSGEGTVGISSLRLEEM